jgi:hypothetical protein
MLVFLLICPVEIITLGKEYNITKHVVVQNFLMLFTFANIIVILVSAPFLIF